ncbi:phospholipase [Nocardioides KLBMP 9356]|uniref:Phospholipase n=1 Tax=Nocardioides potassii TaxID=2911371 RepID=A0ABS9HGX5_9ACTN|nr:phospholipase [Nocardioides potassii]MCF6379368.1 phospholipase [Nocardioides potassii]
MDDHAPHQAYAALSDSVFALYEAGQQREALNLLDGAGPELLPWRSELAHLRACLHGSLGEPDAALATLDGAHAAGGWWDPEILVEDDDLSALTGLPEFVALVESSRERWARANAEPDRTGDRLALPSGRARGLVVALHGAEEDADDALAAWGPATDLGFVVLAVRSSQRTSPCYRSWPDQERAGAEIADALETLPAEARDLPVVAGGFSAGGRVAVQWALSGMPCAVAGVVAVAPAVRGDLAPSHQAALDPALLVVGSDDDLRDDVVAAGRRLAGFTADVVEGLAHRFPKDFAGRLATALGPFG